MSELIKNWIKISSEIKPFIISIGETGTNNTEQHKNCKAANQVM